MIVVASVAIELRSRTPVCECIGVCKCSGEPLSRGCSNSRGCFFPRFLKFYGGSLPSVLLDRVQDAAWVW